MLKMRKTIVINTGPLIALVAGFGDLSILQKIYDRVIVPYEVTKEMLANIVQVKSSAMISLML